ncbi:MAG: MerR family transcriptional regulator [Ferruginibacter sp.]
MAIKQFTFDFAAAEEAANPDAEKSFTDNEVAASPGEDLINLVEEEKAPRAENTKSSKGRKKLTDPSLDSDLLEIPADEILFSKQYYPIGKVAEMFHVNISLIRYWENEFSILKPKKNGKGDRLFRPEDVKNLQLIYHLLRDKKYTLEGAREFIKRAGKVEANFTAIESLKNLKSFLLELKNNL